MTAPARIPAALRELLACPRCRGPLQDVQPDMRQDQQQEPEGAAFALDCAACGLRFPVRDGIPVMLIEQATRIVAGA